ncbi:hypothetical protein [Caulobacter sp. Root655]|nr:hypothetical protein [Caulobacter sp. Root655]
MANLAWRPPQAWCGRRARRDGRRAAGAKGDVIGMSGLAAYVSRENDLG